MEPKAKRKLAEAVRKHFSRGLEPLAFARTKPTFWTRSEASEGPRVQFVQFVHLHLFTFDPSFRVHLGVRILNDTFGALALNGLSSHDGWALAARKYVFGFSMSDGSTTKCADELVAFVAEVGVPWFESLAVPDALLASDSPLSDAEKASLRLALDGHADAAAIAASRKLLGISD